MPDLDIDLPVYITSTNGEIAINDVTIDGVSEMEVIKTAGDASGTFSATIQNVNGQNNSAFTLNDDVKLYFPDEDGLATLVMRGYIDSIDNTQFGRITIKGQDYTGLLHRVIMNEVFTNAEVSAVITNASTGVYGYMSDFGITINHVQTTTTTLDAYKISQKSAWDVMKELAEQANYAFYVDKDKDLHFEPKATVSSAKELRAGTGGNVNSYNLLSDYRQSFNSITVYGAETFVRGQTSGANYPTETFNGDGTTTAFVLTHTPNQPILEVKVGGVAKTEGTDYSVDYALSTINFVTAPGAGTGNIYVTYDYTSMVLASAENASSIAENGLSEKVINDRDITSTARARIAADAYLQLYSDPKAVLNVKTRGIYASTAECAQSVQVTIEGAGVQDETYNIAQLKFKWGKGGFTCDWTLATIDITLAEVLKELKSDIVELKRRGISKVVVSETTVTAILQMASITLTTKTKYTYSSKIWGVSTWGQRGYRWGDRRDVAWA